MALAKPSFADVLYGARNKKNLSQKELAKMLGLNSASINNWERGGFFPRLDYAIRLADILGFSLDNLSDSKAVSERLSVRELKKMRKILALKRELAKLESK